MSKTLLKRTQVNIRYYVEDTVPATNAEIRTNADEWTGSAVIEARTVGQHKTADEARAALAIALRNLADMIERDGDS